MNGRAQRFERMTANRACLAYCPRGGFSIDMVALS
jgi:hypothetical protein